MARRALPWVLPEVNASKCHNRICKINMEQLQAALAANMSQAGSLPPGLLQLFQAASTAVQPLDVHICSPGGVGSTTFSNFLTRHGLTTNLLQDQDGLRHAPRPPAWCYPDNPSKPHPAKPRSVVYMYGNPYHVVASHYRRGHAYHQALKTGGLIARSVPEHAFPATPEEYFQRGQDLFGLQGQFNAWRAGAMAYDIILLRYGSMFDPEVVFPLFSALCGHKCDEEQIQSMCMEWMSSKSQRLSATPAGAMESGLYDQLAQHMEDLPGLLVVSATAAAHVEDVHMT